MGTSAIPQAGRFRPWSTLIAAAVASHIAAIASAKDVEPEWVADWAVAKGLSLGLDTSGYHFPSAIAFVPDPGGGPDDPLYFVTELRGTLKVVTNDRAVHVFADGISNVRPAIELPAKSGETGMAGICLDPVRGYVFVTYAYTDKDGVFRNNVARFTSTPKIFSLKPAGRIDFIELFANDVSELSHQIGPCQVVDDALYVSVGNGENIAAGRRINSTLGKVLRMTLDGKPYPGNPFQGAAGRQGPADYVWAYGLRNPFSLGVVHGRVFVADNGPATDRFLEVRKGEDYKFDGSEWSIGLGADLVFSPAVSPVGMDFQGPGQGGLGPLYQDAFYLALGGTLSRPGPGLNGSKSLVAFSYDFAGNRVVDVPKKIVEYRGDGVQIIVGVGVGGDGVYFVPMLPDKAGLSGIFRVAAGLQRAHPFVIGGNDGPSLIEGRNCLGCHHLGPIGNSQGPSLDRNALISAIPSRLASPAYRRDASKRDAAERAEIDKILALRGEARIRAWMIQHLQTPGFDNPDSRMPDLGLTAAEARLLTDYLLLGNSSWLRDHALNRARLIVTTQRSGLAVGLAGGLGLAVMVYLFAARRRARNARA